MGGSYEILYYRKNHNGIWLQEEIISIRNEESIIVLFLVTFRDITPFKGIYCFCGKTHKKFRQIVLIVISWNFILKSILYKNILTKPSDPKTKLQKTFPFMSRRTIIKIKILPRFNGSWVGQFLQIFWASLFFSEFL